MSPPRGINPAAELMPEMNSEQYASLVEDIRIHGQLDPIVLDAEGRILDGRHRYRACTDLGIEPRTVTWDGEGGDVVSFVLSSNLHRRHLTTAQRAAIAVRMKVFFAIEAQRRKVEGGRRGAARRNRPDQDPARMPDAPFFIRGEAREHAGRLLSVSPRYVTYAERVHRADRGLFEQLLADTLTIPDALRMVDAQQREAQIAANREQVALTGDLNALIGRNFGTVVADPPWRFRSETLPDKQPPYSLMDDAAIAAMPVSGLAAPAAHLYLWVTHDALPRGFEIMRAWGFEYRQTLTWVKSRAAMTRFFHTSTEFVLFGSRGGARLGRQGATTHFEGKRGRHSEKPAEFYRLVVGLSPPPWLELFSRKARPGWTAWGAEAEPHGASSHGG